MYTYTHTYISIYVYIYFHIYVCVCMCATERGASDGPEEARGDQRAPDRLPQVYPAPCVFSLRVLLA